MITEDSCELIDALIKQGRSFALWRVAGDDCLHFGMQTYGSPELLYDISDLNGRTGFVIAPFQISSKHPVVVIKPDCLDLPEDILESPQDMIEVLAHEAPVVLTEQEEKKQYESAFCLFSRPLLKGTQDKLVLSRSKTVKRRRGLSPANSFFKACKRYIYSYVYLLHTPVTGTWMGSTPEVLLAGKGKDWQTVALAGTQRLVDGKLPAKWDSKNCQEQQLVASYIRHQLAALNIHPDEKGPYSVRAGELSHLKSIFKFALPDTRMLGDVLSLLHPTPAVCGLPKEDAFRFIIEKEGYDRSYYSGFVGWLSPTGQTDIYVNLRCVNIHPDTYTLFAGGGLLASSDLEDEWEETIDKMKTMQNILE